MGPNPSQRKLIATLEGLNRNREGLVSPYTVTLGDEFQAVFKSANRIFADMFNVLGALHPVGVRFSYAVGTISTRINKQSAVGMDGPAFYAAREGISLLKQSGEMFHLASLDSNEQLLAQASLRVASHAMRRWKGNRYRILHDILEGKKVQNIAQDLNISEQAVYKNIESGGLGALAELFGALAMTINPNLEG